MDPDLSNPCLEELLEHADWVRGLARRLVSDDASAEDLAQETLLAALRRPSAPRFGLRPWLAGVMRHMTFRRVREESARRRRERSVARAESTPPPLEQLERADVQRMLADAVMELREPVRVCILLRYREGMSTTEIASMRGVPVGTVRSHLSRGVEAIRARLDERARGGRRAWIAACLPLAGRKSAPLASWAPWAVAAAALCALAVSLRLAAGGGALAAAPSGSQLLANAGARAESDARPLAAPGLGAAGARESADVRDAVAAPAIDGARLEGEVLDAVTREPVPRFALDVEAADGRVESMETDANGRFVSSRPLPEGTLAVALRDLPGAEPLRRFAHVHRVVDGRAERATFVAPLGPTFALQVQLPDGVRASDLDAVFRGSDAPRSIHGRLWGTVGPDPVRDGETPWIRFRAEAAADVSVIAPWTIALASRDGLWWGEARVQQFQGRCAEPIAVSLRAAGSLRGRVREPDGKAPDRAVLHLEWPGGEARGGMLSGAIQTDVDASGEYVFRGLAPGAYTLRSESPRHERVETSALVEAGGVAELDLALPRKPSAGDVRGVVRSRSGAFDRMSVAGAHCLSQPGTAAASTVLLTANVEWSGPPGARVGRFCFESLPSGKYVVRMTRIDASQHEWRPMQRVVEPGGAELEFECVDDAPSADLVVRAYDAATGARLPLCDVATFLEGTTPKRRRHVEFGGLIHARVPITRGLLVSVRAEGYRTAAFDGAAIVDEGVAGQRVIEARLERGWSAPIVVRGDGEQPVAGATVLVDGECAGVTDRSGALLVSRPARPHSIFTKLPGAIQESTFAVDAETGRFCDLDWTRIDVRMRSASVLAPR